VKLFPHSVAATCRYGDIATSIWHSWTLLWEDSEADYQGHARFLVARKSDFTATRYCYYSWTYGSCSGCDDWEARELDFWQIANEMEEDALWFDSKEDVLRWVVMLERPEPERAQRLREAVLTFNPRPVTITIRRIR